MNMNDTKWLIWSNEHKGWWKPFGNGYCKSRAHAGRYSFEIAASTVRNANCMLKDEPNEAMVLDEKE